MIWRGKEENIVAEFVILSWYLSGGTGENNELANFYRCTVHYWIYIVFTHQQIHYLLNLEKFKFILKYT